MVQKIFSAQCSSSNLPNQKELEKEISDYLSNKYGERVKIVTSNLLPNEGVVDDEAEPPKDKEIPLYTNFTLKPEELVLYLDDYVVQQVKAKAILSTKICTHFNRIRTLFEKDDNVNHDLIGRIKNNVLLVGPTGVGKTYLVKLIAQKIGVPFVKGDATKFSETGYVGADVEDLIRDLVREADGDIEKAQYGIIYIDEVDKLAKSHGRFGADISRSGVQRALLKPMEETEVELKVPHDIISQMEAMEQFRATGKREKRTINTKNILFIMSGAFDGLGEIIRKRNQKQTMGFEGELAGRRDPREFLSQVKSEDLVRFGFESEFVGRLPVIAVLDWLTEEDLFQILINPNCSVVLAKKQDFQVYGVHIIFSHGAYRAVARLALLEKTGARGLVSVIERVLLPFEKALPSTDISYLCVQEKIVASPEQGLHRLLNDQKYRDTNAKQFHQQRKKEFDLLCQISKSGPSSLSGNQGNAVTSSRHQIIASICQAENVGFTVAISYVFELISHIESWEHAISEECGIAVHFDEAARDAILVKRPRNKKSIDNLCSNLMAIFEYGIRLLTEKKDIHDIVIPAHAIEKPEEFINDLVKSMFSV